MPNINELQINGARARIDAEAERSLLSVLRDDLDLTGSKYGCGEGRCGACTVLIGGKATRSCVTAAGHCEGKRITTTEGLEQKGELHPLQTALLEVGAMQCGLLHARDDHVRGRPGGEEPRASAPGGVPRAGGQRLPLRRL